MQTICKRPLPTLAEVWFYVVYFNSDLVLESQITKIQPTLPLNLYVSQGKHHVNKQLHPHQEKEALQEELKTQLTVTSKADQNLVNRIAKGEDKGGELTEQLFNSLAKQNGFTVIKGGKYGSNNGFDHVWVAKDGSVTILSDSKQITNGTVKLAPNAAGGNTQLSADWITSIINNLSPNDPARKVIEQAREAGKLKTAVTGVDRSTGKAVIIPVNVPSKSAVSKVRK